jgi:hypothetical protein
LSCKTLRSQAAASSQQEQEPQAAGRQQDIWPGAAAAAAEQQLESAARDRTWCSLSLARSARGHSCEAVERARVALLAARPVDLARSRALATAAPRLRLRRAVAVGPLGQRFSFLTHDSFGHVSRLSQSVRDVVADHACRAHGVKLCAASSAAVEWDGEDKSPRIRKRAWPTSISLAA